MDLREASAMTEASGLVDDPDDNTPASGAGPDGATARDSPPFQFNSAEVALKIAERLREVAIKAPLQSLFVAFLLGVWVARRR